MANGDGTDAITSWSDLAVPDALQTLIDQGPRTFVRGVVVGWLISGLVAVLKPIFASIQLLFLGSDPATFAATGETWGLLDALVVIPRLFGGALNSLIRAIFGALVGIIEVAFPQVPGPIEGIIATVVMVMLAIAFARLGFPILLGLLEAVPVVGGPLATLLDKLQ